MYVLKFCGMNIDNEVVLWKLNMFIIKMNELYFWTGWLAFWIIILSDLLVSEQSLQNVEHKCSLLQSKTITSEVQ